MRRSPPTAAPATLSSKRVSAIWPPIRKVERAVAGSTDSALARLHHVRDVRPRQAERRRKTEENSSDKSEGYGEDEDGPVESDRGLLGEGVWHQLHRKLGQPVRQRGAECCAGKGDGQGLNQKLADDTKATCSDG